MLLGSPARVADSGVCGTDILLCADGSQGTRRFASASRGVCCCCTPSGVRHPYMFDIVMVVVAMVQGAAVTQADVDAWLQVRLSVCPRICACV